MSDTRRHFGDTIAFGALFAFVVVMYAAPSEWIPAAEPLRLALVCSVVAFGAMALGRIGSGRPVSADGARGWALIGFCGLCAASIRWSLNPDETTGLVIDLLKLAAIYFTIVNIVQDTNRLRWLCVAVVLASMVTSVGVIQWYLIGENLSEGFRARWLGVYADPNRMAMALAIVVPLALAIVARKDQRMWLRLSSTAAAILAVVAIVFSHSRGGFIGLGAGVFIWALREKKHRFRSTLVAGGLAVGMLLFAPKSFWDRNETVAQFGEDASAMGRVHAWTVTSNMSTDRPLLGVGLGSFKYAWPLYAPPEAHHAYLAHNVFLEVVGELGFVGLFFWLVFVGGAGAVAFVKTHSEEQAWLARALSASVAAYLVCSLFAGYAISAHLYVLFGLAACADRIARGSATTEALQTATSTASSGAVPA